MARLRAIIKPTPAEDVDVLPWAELRKCSLASIIPIQLQFLATQLEMFDEIALDNPDSIRRLLRVLVVCDKLFRSSIFEKLLKAVDWQLEQKQKLETDLGKLGAYYHGLELLFSTLIQPCQQGAAPLKLRTCFVRSPANSRVKLVGSGWYELLRRTWYDSGRGELGISEDTLAQEWGKAGESKSLHIPDEMSVKLHCELRLLSKLEELGIRKGIIGVSKACCELCCIAIADLNAMGSQWRATSGHGRMYVGRRHQPCAEDDCSVCEIFPASVER
jgi:hypothetical protein